MQQCIDYAIKNNIQIKQQEISAGISKEDLIRNKAQVLPNLNGKQSNDFSYGRNFDVGSGRLTTKETFSQSFGLSANLTIFSGLQTYNNILQSRYGYEAGKMDVDKMKNDIALNVATAYLQVLFNIENFELAKVQTTITGSQVKRITAMVDAGAMAKSNLLDIAAQLASDEYTATTAKNNVDISYLTLAQFLNLDSIGGFSIVKPDLNAPGEAALLSTPTQIYSSAASRLPEIKSAELKLRSSQKNVLVAKGAISPHVAVGANYGSRYSEANRDLLTGNLIPYNDQINQNTYKSLSFQVSVPLFNKLQTTVSISKAKLSMENAKYNLELTQDQVRKTILQAHADAQAALVKYNAGTKSLEAREEFFKYAEQKFNVGAINSYEYSDAKNKLTKAQSDVLQAKYDYIFKTKVLDFYLGKPLTF